MKNCLTVLVAYLCFSVGIFGQNTVELNPNQSMSITGKGPGQDAILNPYTNEQSIARVKNLGKNSFFVRIELDGREISNVEVDPKKTKEFMLDKGFVLYLDSKLEGKAKVTYKKYKEKYNKN